MAIIYTYPLASTVDPNDTLVISQTNNKNATRTVSLQTIANWLVPENAWSQIDTYTGGGLTGSAIAVGVNQLLNLTSGSLTFTNPDSSTINIEAPAGDGNIADRNLTFTNNWQSDLIDFNWAVIDSTLPAGERDVMGFDKDYIKIGGNNSLWWIPINNRSLGGAVDPGTGGGPTWPGNIFLGGDDTGASDHQYLDTSIAIGVNALPFGGSTDYFAASGAGSENDTELIAIGYDALRTWGTNGPVSGEQGGQNIAIGPYSQSLNAGFISPTQTGSYNVSIGGRSLEDLNGGEMNTVLGHNAAWLATTANRNIVVGMEAADGNAHNVGTPYTSAALTVGSDNIILGYHADVDDNENALVIGNDSFTADSVIAADPFGVADNTMVIGNTTQSFGEGMLVIGNLNTQDLGIPYYGVRETGWGGVTAVGHRVTAYNPNPGVHPDNYMHVTIVGGQAQVNGYANDAFGEAAAIGTYLPGVESEVENSITLGNYSWIIGSQCVNIGVDSSLGTPGLGTPIFGATAVGYGSDVQFNGGVALGEGVTPAIDNEFTVRLGGSQDISLVGKVAASGAASIMTLAGNLELIGNKAYASAADPPNILRQQYQQTEVTGQSVAAQNTVGTIMAGPPALPDMNLGDILNVTLDGTAGAVIDFGDAANRKPGTYIWIVAQGAVPASINWVGASYRWVGGIAPVLSGGVGDVDIITFVCDGAGLMFGTAVTGF